MLTGILQQDICTIFMQWVTLFAPEIYIIFLFNVCIILGTVLIAKAATCCLNIIQRKIMILTAQV